MMGRTDPIDREQLRRWSLPRHEEELTGTTAESGSAAPGLRKRVIQETRSRGCSDVREQDTSPYNAKPDSQQAQTNQALPTRAAGPGARVVLRS